MNMTFLRSTQRINQRINQHVIIIVKFDVSVPGLIPGARKSNFRKFKSYENLRQLLH